jgi:hypothetical protein
MAASPTAPRGRAETGGCPTRLVPDSTRLEADSRCGCFGGPIAAAIGLSWHAGRLAPTLTAVRAWRPGPEPRLRAAR